MSLFPGAIASFLGFTSGHTLSADQHAAQHNSEQAEIIAAQTKIGTGSSTPASGLLLRGSGAGSSAWAQVNQATDVTGVLPVANGGTSASTASAARTALGVNTLLELLPSIYPIGCIYTEITGVNPATTFGFGTWAQFGQGQVLIGQKATDTDYQTVLTAGGAKTVNLAHTHGGVTDNGTAQAVQAGADGAARFVWNQATGQHTHAISSDLSSAQSIVQPFVVVYFWRRTA